MHKHELSAGFACGMLMDDSSIVQLDEQDALESKARQQQKLQEAATSKPCNHLKNRRYVLKHYGQSETITRENVQS